MRKKLIVLTMVAAILLVICCGCSNKKETEQCQVWKVAYEIEANYVAYITSPAPVHNKTFSYSDYFVAVNFVEPGKDFEKTVIDRAKKDVMGNWNLCSEDIDVQNSKEINGMETYTAKCSWDIDEDGENDYYSMVTGIDAEYGSYVFNTYATNPDNFATAQKQHKKIIKSIEMTEADDPEVFAKDVGQVNDLLFSMEGWDRRMVHNGVVAYLSETELEYYMMIKPVNELVITDENLSNTVMSIYSGAFENAEIIEQKAPVKTKVGNAIWTSFKLSMGEQSMNTSALFVCNDSDKIIACFMVPYDEELEADYKEIIDSIQYFDVHEEQLHNLWDDKTDYIGENDNVVKLASDVGFRDYTVELETEKEPYGLIVKVKDDDIPENLERECVLLLGLIDNLDHVTIITDSNTYTMNVDQARSVLKYDVKKLNKSKPLLERYLMETYI